MKKWVLNGLIGLLIGIVVIIFASTLSLKIKMLATFLLNNTNNAVWEIGANMFSLILFFVLGILTIPLIKLGYGKLRKKQKKIEKIKIKHQKKIEKVSEEINAKIFSVRTLKKATKMMLYLFLIVFIGIIIFNLAFVPTVAIIQEEPHIFGAHRGNSLSFIENTIPAFEDALNDEKYNFIEFDIQYSKDKQIIVFHDDDLLRLQELSYKVKDLTYDELCNISKYHIPLYGEVMDLIGDKKPLNIEIKSQGNFEDDKKMVDFVIEDLEKRNILNQTLISSISSESIIYVKQKNFDIKTGKIYYISTGTFFHFEMFASTIINELEKTDADYLMLHGSNLRNYESLRKLMPDDKTLAFWYFDDQMYIINSETSGSVFSIRPSIKTFIDNIKKTFGVQVEEEICIWWC